MGEQVPEEQWLEGILPADEWLCVYTFQSLAKMDLLTNAECELSVGRQGSQFQQTRVNSKAKDQCELAGRLTENKRQYTHQMSDSWATAGCHERGKS